EDAFRKLPIHWMWWPALGGLVVGIGGLLYPRALGVGYDTLHDLLTGRLVGAMLLGLMLTKAVIWAVALGSGTSGGVLAPLLIMGGSLGALEAHWTGGDPGLWAADVMEKDVPTVPASLPVDTLFVHLAALDPLLARRQAWPVVDDGGRLVGMLTRGDLVLALEQVEADGQTVLEAGTRALVLT